MQQIPTTELLKQIGKDARSYMIFLLVGIVWYFVFRFTGATTQINTNCEEEKDSLRVEKRELTIQLNVKDKMIFDLFTQVSKKDETLRQLDTLLRTKLEDKTKENLQNR